MKIAIIGYSGCGKSTLAKQLGREYGLPVLHLDQVHWLPGWVERSLQEEKAEIETFLDQNEGWVIDGNYSSSLYDRRMEEADYILWLCFNRMLCLWRVAKRYWQNRGRTRDSMTQGCEEKLDLEFIWWVLYEGRSPRKEVAYRQLAARYPDKVAVLRSPRQLENWLSR